LASATQGDANTGKFEITSNGNTVQAISPSSLQTSDGAESMTAGLTVAAVASALYLQ